MIAREWTRIGILGFGGPPAHIALMRRLCVEQRRWMTDVEFEDGIAATNLLPGPASTQLAIYCAWRLRRIPGAIVGGVGFIVPGLVTIVALSALFFARRPPLLVRGAAAGAGAVVAAVALAAAISLVGPSRRRAAAGKGAFARWSAYLVAGGLTAALDGEFLVAVLVACGAIEVLARGVVGRRASSTNAFAPFVLGTSVTAAGLGALVWESFKVGALSYGGGFVIIPLMQHDVVHIDHWMSNAQFLTAVALGQITPGPVVLTVAAVGFAASRFSGAAIATVCGFLPSFAFVAFGGPYFERLRTSRVAQAVLSGAGPCAIGGIAGSAIPLGLGIAHLWQVGVLVGGILWLVVLRRNIVIGLLLAAAFGVIAAAGGLPVAR